MTYKKDIWKQFIAVGSQNKGFVPLETAFSLLKDSSGNRTANEPGF